MLEKIVSFNFAALYGLLFILLQKAMNEKNKNRIGKVCYKKENLTKSKDVKKTKGE